MFISHTNDRIRNTKIARQISKLTRPLGYYCKIIARHWDTYVMHKIMNCRYQALQYDIFVHSEDGLIFFMTVNKS